MLAASPLAEGLFQGAISQSGGSFGPTRKPSYPGENMYTLAQAEADGVKYVESFGASSIAELRQMDAETFIPQHWPVTNAWPIVDGHVIPGDQHELYQQGRYNDVPVLVGYKIGRASCRERGWVGMGDVEGKHKDGDERG